MDVPFGAAASDEDVTFPPSISTITPDEAPLSEVIILTWATEAMLESASPRNPMVRMASRSASLVILLVAWRKKAFSASSFDRPRRLSITRIRRLPACSISMKISVAPASTEFSISSLTTDAGRSTTSPAAILFTIWSGSIFIMEDIIYRSQKTAVRIQTNTGVLNRFVSIKFRISKATRSNYADQQPAADLPLLQGEGRGEDGLVQRPLNTHPHLNPPLEGEETYFRSWGKKTSSCITFAEVNSLDSGICPLTSASILQLRLFLVRDDYDHHPV